MKASVLMLLITSLGAFQCGKPLEVNVACVKGKYLGLYCEGAVIQLVEDAQLGRTWKGMYTDQIFQNCVVASLDTTVFKSTAYPSFMTTDSTFYFQYKDGGYPRKQYNVCEPSAFITITGISESPCVFDSAR